MPEFSDPVSVGFPHTWTHQPNGYYPPSSSNQPQNTFGSHQYGRPQEIHQPGYQYHRPQPNSLISELKKSRSGLKLQPYEFNTAPPLYVAPKIRPRPQIATPTQTQQVTTPNFQQQPTNVLQNNPSQLRQEPQGSLQNAAGSHTPSQQPQFSQQPLGGQQQQATVGVSYNQPQASSPGNFATTSAQATSSATYNHQRPSYAESSSFNNPGIALYQGNNLPNNLEVSNALQRPSNPAQNPSNPVQVPTNGYQYHQTSSRPQETVPNSQNPNSQNPSFSSQGPSNGYQYPQGNFQQSFNDRGNQKPEPQYQPSSPGTNEVKPNEHQQGYPKGPNSNFQGYGNQKPSQETNFLQHRPGAQFNQGLQTSKSETEQQIYHRPEQGNTQGNGERIQGANQNPQSTINPENDIRPAQGNSLPNSDNLRVQETMQTSQASNNEVGQQNYPSRVPEAISNSHAFSSGNTQTNYPRPGQGNDFTSRDPEGNQRPVNSQPEAEQQNYDNRGQGYAYRTPENSGVTGASSRPETGQQNYPRPALPSRENPKVSLNSEQQNYPRPGQGYVYSTTENGAQSNALPSKQNMDQQNNFQAVQGGQAEANQRPIGISGALGQPEAIPNPQPSYQRPENPTTALNNGNSVLNGNSSPGQNSQGYSYQSQPQPAGPLETSNNGYPRQNPPQNPGYSYQSQEALRQNGEQNGKSEATQESAYPQNVRPLAQQGTLPSRQESSPQGNQRPQSNPGYSYQPQQNLRPNVEQNGMGSNFPQNRQPEAQQTPLPSRQESEQQRPQSNQGYSYQYQQNLRPNMGQNGNPIKEPESPQNRQTEANQNSLQSGPGFEHQISEGPGQQNPGENLHQNSGYPQAMRPNPEVTYQPQVPQVNQNFGQPVRDLAVQPGSQVSQEDSAGTQAPVGSSGFNNGIQIPSKPMEVPIPARQYLPPFSNQESQTPSSDLTTTEYQNLSADVSTSSASSSSSSLASQYQPQNNGPTSQQANPQQSNPPQALATTTASPLTSNTISSSPATTFQNFPSPSQNENASTPPPTYNTQPWNPIKISTNRVPKQQSLNLPQGYRYSTPSMKQTAEHAPTFNGVVYNELGMGMNASSSNLIPDEMPKVENATQEVMMMGKTEIETQQGYVYGRPEVGLKEPQGVTLLRPVDSMPEEYVYYKKQQQKQEGGNGTQNSYPNQEGSGTSSQGNEENIRPLKEMANKPNQDVMRPSNGGYSYPQLATESVGNSAENSRPLQDAQLPSGTQNFPHMGQPDLNRPLESLQNENSQLSAIRPMGGELRPEDSNKEQNRPVEVMQDGNLHLGAIQPMEASQNTNNGYSQNSQVPEANGQNDYLNQQYPYKQVSALNQVNRIPQGGQPTENLPSRNQYLNPQGEGPQPENSPAYQQHMQQISNENRMPFNGQFPSNHTQEAIREQSSQPPQGNQGFVMGPYANQGEQTQFQPSNRPEMSQNPVGQSHLQPSPAIEMNQGGHTQVPVQQTIQVTETQAMIPLFRPSPQFQSNGYNYGQTSGNNPQMVPQNQVQVLQQNQAASTSFQPSSPNFMGISRPQENSPQNMQPAMMDYPAQKPAQFVGYSNQVPQQQLQVPSQNSMIFPQNPQEIVTLQTTTPNSLMAFFSTPNPIENQVISSSNPPRDVNSRPMTFEETKSYMQMPSHSFELPSSYIMVPSNAEQALMPQPRTANSAGSTVSESTEENTQNPQVTEEPVRQPHLVYGLPDQAEPTTVTPEPLAEQLSPVKPMENEGNPQNPMAFLENPIVYNTPEQPVTSVTPETLQEQTPITTEISVPTEVTSANSLVFLENPIETQQPIRQPHLIYGSPVYEATTINLPSPMYTRFYKK
ncbi:uncharacterized protein LOC133325338 [Musca vetustissima]|uniref:uncharacterized protein LOC133325338 n=1 Tax=Musca vetustissima TaxID=27455 RepID=UPI002AB7D3BE|nr:uncharacterized protein LOC133325338 [Musca vetustissima]